MSPGEIFEFTDPREVLVHVYQAKKNRNPMFSIRAWAKRLGFRNPSYLSDVLNGKRKLKPEFALRIADSLDFSDDEQKFFEALVFLDNAKTDPEKDFFRAVAARFMPERQTKAFGPAKVAEVKEWYYGVLDEMTCLADFKEDPTYLAKRLGGDVTSQAVELAIKEMLKIGLVYRDNKGRLKRPSLKWIIQEESDPKKKEHPAIRKYKKKFLEKAIVAIDEQSKGETCFRQTNLPIRRKDFERVIELFNNVFKKIYELESGNKADEIYQVGVACYRVTDGKTV